MIMYSFDEIMTEDEKRPVTDAYSHGGISPPYYIRKHQTPRVKYSLRTKLIGLIVIICLILFMTWIYLSWIYQSTVHP